MNKKREIYNFLNQIFSGFSFPFVQQFSSSAEKTTSKLREKW